MPKFEVPYYGSSTATVTFPDDMKFDRADLAFLGIALLKMSVEQFGTTELKSAAKKVFMGMVAEISDKGDETNGYQVCSDTVTSC